MTSPAYPAAHLVADTIEAHFANHVARTQVQDGADLAPAPDRAAVENIIEAAFWASLRREEGYSPKISLAYLPPSMSHQPLTFAHHLPFTSDVLTKLAPAVERPGIHLGVWRTNQDGDELCIWGTTRDIPRLCFVLEVIEPGLLVVKYRRGAETGKFVNVVVLKGDQIKVVDEHGTSLVDCPALLSPLLGFGAPTEPDAVNVLVQLAVSMRAHGRGGSLLVVPEGSDEWRESIIQPVSYAVAPPFAELAQLMRRPAKDKTQPAWQEEFIDSVDAIAGLTAVDGAALINDKYELLAFGGKITRRRGAHRIERVAITEPVIGSTLAVVAPLQLGNTRHLSAAQFVHDQRNAVALVASQDGRFTVFAWSPCENMVHAHRVEALLM